MTHLCIVCPQLRQGEPRVYDRAQVCEGCRPRLRVMLVDELAEHYAHLSLRRTTGGGAKVSGSRTPPLPLAVGALDATMPPGRSGAVSSDLVPLYDTVQVEVDVWLPARPTTEDEYPMVTVPMAQRRRRRDDRGILAYGLSGDQVGEASVPAILDEWARDWQTYRWATLPVPTVVSLTRWLGERLEWACDHHPAIDDFAWELNEVVRALRPRGPKAELKKGVPCRSCDRVTLFRWPASDRIECGSCPALMTLEEYDDWAALITAPQHREWITELAARESNSRREIDRIRDAPAAL